MRLFLVFQAVALPISTMALLGGCGGGGTAINSAPVVGPAPAPATVPTSTQVNFLRQPATQEFTAFAAGDPLRVRYDAASATYEVNAVGSWATVYRVASQNTYQVGSPDQQAASASIQSNTSPDSLYPGGLYQYANWSSWSGWKGVKDVHGQLVFGTPTPASAVPVTGTASYSGYVAGTSTATADGGGWGPIQPAPLIGSISMQANFAKGTLSGSVNAGVSCDCGPVPFIAQMAFSGTIASGRNELAGSFTAPMPGANYIRGLFAGPGAEEAFGEWAFSHGVDGKWESATGVWIAKK